MKLESRQTKSIERQRQISSSSSLFFMRHRSRDLAPLEAKAGNEPNRPVPESFPFFIYTIRYAQVFIIIIIIFISFLGFLHQSSVAEHRLHERTERATLDLGFCGRRCGGCGHVRHESQDIQRASGRQLGLVRSGGSGGRCGCGSFFHLAASFKRFGLAGFDFRRRRRRSKRRRGSIRSSDESATLFLRRQKAPFDSR